MMEGSCGTGKTMAALTAGATLPRETDQYENIIVTAYEERISPNTAYFASGGFDAEAAAREAYVDSGIGGGDSYAHAFRTPGAYEYFCVAQKGTGTTGTVEVWE